VDIRQLLASDVFDLRNQFELVWRDLLILSLFRCDAVR